MNMMKFPLSILACPSITGDHEVSRSVEILGRNVRVDVMLVVLSIVGKVVMGEVIIAMGNVGLLEVVFVCSRCVGWLDGMCLLSTKSTVYHSIVTAKTSPARTIDLLK